MARDASKPVQVRMISVSQYAQNLTRDKPAICPHNADKEIPRNSDLANLMNEKQQPIKKRQKFISIKCV